MAEAPVFATARRTFHLLGSAGLAVAALYWGQKILIPFALAVLLAFVLTPGVARLERHGLKRVPAVLLVVCLAFVLVSGAGWIVATRMASLVSDLPRYKENVRDKIDQLQGAARHSLLSTVEDFLGEIEKASHSRTGEAAPGLVVRVQPERPSLFAQLQAIMSQFLGALTAALAVVLLVICLLIYREDVRNRLIRLAGSGRLVLTTRALDETGRRIGRYLLGHALVNAVFGVAVGVGLFLIGVPYAALWGLLAGVFRFVPSVGPWLVAPFPAVLALISSPGLTQPLLALGLFLVLELLCANVLQPRACGPSIGVAPVPLLLSVMFWTSVWGIVGLVLATPLTVCVAVLGKYVPQLGFLAVLLGNGSPLRTSARYYQRLLARDRDEAAAILKDYLRRHSIVRLFDRVLVPALVLVRRGQRDGELRPEDRQFILRTTRELLNDLDWSPPIRTPVDGAAGVPVLGLPASDEVDEVALLMLCHLVRADGQDVRVVGGDELSSGMVSLVQQERPAIVFIAAVAPGGLAEARYLCERLRSQFPTLRIVSGRWGQRRGPRRSPQALLAAGAERVVTTLREARSQLAQLIRTSARLQEMT
jgi:predicted PurR-regulated permease PerM